MVKIKSRKIAAFAIAAMMAASITPAMAAPSFASEDNTEATTMDAEEMIVETEDAVAEPEEIMAEPEEIVAEPEEEVAAEESQQEEMFSAKGSIRAMAATSPSQAQTISFGQTVSGSFVARETYSGSGSYYMDTAVHYYKFRTGSTSGATYVVKGEYQSSPGGYDSYGVYYELLDSNYTSVEFNDCSAQYSIYHKEIRLSTNQAGSMTYKSLSPNTYYYIKVTCSSGYNITRKNYTVAVTTNGSTPTTTPTQTPSLVTPTLTLDKARIVTEDKNNAYVSGNVSYACGQYVFLYDSTGNDLLGYAVLANSKAKESFRIKIPSANLNDGENSFKVKAWPIKNIVNSSNIANLTVKIGKDDNTYEFVIGPTTNSSNQIVRVTVNGSVYEVLKSGKVGGPMARLVKANNAKSVTIPASVKYKNTYYDVKGIQPGAFANSNAKTVTIKTRMLSKAAVKGSLNGSKVKTVKVNILNKKLSKSFVKKYKTFFTKSNCGKKVKVKR